MAPSRSPDGSGPAANEPDSLPGDDDVIIPERATLRHRLPNQHDLESDDDQVVWSTGGAPWLDDDLEDAIWPHRGPDDSHHPAPGI